MGDGVIPARKWIDGRIPFRAWDQPYVPDILRPGVYQKVAEELKRILGDGIPYRFKPTPIAHPAFTLPSDLLSREITFPIGATVESAEQAKPIHINIDVRTADDFREKQQRAREMIAAPGQGRKRMTWEEMRLMIAREVYKIEMTDGMVTAQESDRRFDLYESLLKEPPPKVITGVICEVDRLVGSTLIAMKEMGLIDYE